MYNGYLCGECLRHHTQSREHRLHGWRGQVRRRWAVQPLHAEHVDLQRQRAAGLRAERAVHRPTCLFWRDAQLQPCHGHLCTVLVCRPVPAVKQRLSQRGLRVEHLHLRPEAARNRLRRGNL